MLALLLPVAKSDQQCFDRGPLKLSGPFHLREDEGNTTAR